MIVPLRRTSTALIVHQISSIWHPHFFFVPTSCIPILLVSIKFSNSYVYIYIREANILKQNSDFVLTCLVRLCLSEENYLLVKKSFLPVFYFCYLHILLLLLRKNGVHEKLLFLVSNKVQIRSILNQQTLMKERNSRATTVKPPHLI